MYTRLDWTDSRCFRLLFLSFCRLNLHRKLAPPTAHTRVTADRRLARAIYSFPFFWIVYSLHNMSNLAIVAPLPAIYPVPGIYPLHARTRAWCRSSFFKAYKRVHRLRSLPPYPRRLECFAQTCLSSRTPSTSHPLRTAPSTRPRMTCPVLTRTRKVSPPTARSISLRVADASVSVKRGSR